MTRDEISRKLVVAFLLRTQSFFRLSHLNRNTMVHSESRTVRIFHPVLFGFTTLIAIITLAIASSLVKFYNDNGYPNGSYRDRIRILLVAAIWTTAIGIYQTVGTFMAPGSILFGVLSHLITVGVGFILFIIGASSLTALTAPQNCAGAFARCNIVKALVGVSWATTILLLVALIMSFGIGVRNNKKHGAAGFTRGAIVTV